MNQPELKNLLIMIQADYLKIAPIYIRQKEQLDRQSQIQKIIDDVQKDILILNQHSCALKIQREKEERSLNQLYQHCYEQSKIEKSEEEVMKLLIQEESIQNQILQETERLDNLKVSQKIIEDDVHEEYLKSQLLKTMILENIQRLELELFEIHQEYKILYVKWKKNIELMQTKKSHLSLMLRCYDVRYFSQNEISCLHCFTLFSSDWVSQFKKMPSHSLASCPHCGWLLSWED